MTLHRIFRGGVPFPARLKMVAAGNTIWRFVHDALTMDTHTKKANTTAWRSNECKRIESFDVMSRIFTAKYTGSYSN